MESFEAIVNGAHKNNFGWQFSVHDIKSLSCHEQVCLAIDYVVLCTVVIYLSSRFCHQLLLSKL